VPFVGREFVDKRRFIGASPYDGVDVALVEAVDELMPGARTSVFSAAAAGQTIDTIKRKAMVILRINA
jgi:hypothetical protein